MPFSDEQRKCPRCGEYESWDMTIQVNGKFYCRKCYIDIFGNKEDKERECIQRRTSTKNLGRRL